MPGGRQARRGVNSLYMRERSPPHADDDPLPEPPTRRTRSGRPRGRPRTRVQPAATQSVDEDDQAVGLHIRGSGTSSDSSDYGEAMIATTGGSTCTASGSTSLGVYLRGPSQLPARPIPLHRRPVIRPSGDNNWEVVSGTGRHINGTLGLLIRQHYPGNVTYALVTSPPWMWHHFYAAEDSEFGTVAAQIKAEFWDLFRCDEGFEDRVARVQDKVCSNVLIGAPGTASARRPLWTGGSWRSGQSSTTSVGTAACRWVGRHTTKATRASSCTPRHGPRRTKARNATSSWRTPWHTRARQRPRKSPTTRRTGQRRTPTRASTASLASTPRRPTSAMGRTSIRPHSPWTQTS